MAGNVSVNSNTDVVVIDTAAPDITLVRTAGADNAASTTGRKYIAAPADANGLANSNIQYKNISSSTTCNSTVTGLTTYSGEITATTGNYCFKVTDKAGNVSYALQTSAIQGVGNPAFDGGTLESGTYYVRSGARTFTGVTANGATVKLYKAATGVTDYTTVTDRIGSDIALAAGVNTVSTSISLPAGTYQLLGSIIPSGGTETPKVKLLDIQTDNTTPTATLGSISSSNSNTSFAKSGDTVTFALNTSERLLLSGTTVAVSGKTASCTDVTGAVHENKVYTCTVSADNTMTEGASVVAVTGQDYAGNSVSLRLTSPSITIDSTAPSAAFTPSAHLVGAGKTATVGINITDSNGIATTFPVTATVSGATPTSATITSAKQTLSLTAGSTEGAVTLDLPSFADTVGNSFDAPAEAMFFVDKTAPSNVSITRVDGGKKRMSISLTLDHGNPATFVFGTTPIAESIHLVFGGSCATFGSERDGVSSAVSTSDGRLIGQTHSFTLKAAKGSYSNCTVKVVDGAGNESSLVTITESITVKGSGGGGRIGGTVRSTIQSISSIFGFGSDNKTASTAGTENQQQQQQTQPPAGQDSEQQTQVALPTRTYVRGERSAFIQRAQEMLNQTACQVASVGHGSAGNETNYLGPATQQALECYQAAQGIAVTGTLTVETYSLLAGVTAQGANTQQQSQTQQTEQTPSPPQQTQETQGQSQTTQSGDSITGTYQIGDSGYEVKQAQILLNRTACRVAASGAGSPGNETIYLGNKTQTALKCYQGLRHLAVNGVLNPTVYDRLVQEVGAAPYLGGATTTTTNTTTSQTTGASTAGSTANTTTQTNTQTEEKKQPIGQNQGNAGAGQQNNNNNNNNILEGYVPIDSAPIYRSNTPANRGAPPAL